MSKQTKQNKAESKSGNPKDFMEGEGASVNKTPRTLSSGGSFHDFETEPIFEGIYKHPVLAVKDNAERNQKKGDVIGYAFDGADDKESIIGNSYSVKLAIAEVIPGAKMSFEFLGKGESGGKPFNKFKIDLLGY